MIITKSKFTKFKLEFDIFRWKLDNLRRINNLLALARNQINKVYTINGKRGGPGDEILYRSIIYTLFYANFLSVSLIAQQERLNYGFDYVDTKLILRAIIERCITQKFILTDPKRLADMFLYWGKIESKRFQSSLTNIKSNTSSALALDIDFEGTFNEWSDKKEKQCQEFIELWESLVKPKQEVTKAKSWSGCSLAEMARQTGLEDIYKLTCRETSWYTHSLITVSDFFLRETDKGMEYSSSTTNLQKFECYRQTEELFFLSFACANEALEWDIASKLRKIKDEDSHFLA